MKKAIDYLVLFKPNFKGMDIEHRHKFIFLNSVYYLAGIITLIMSFMRWGESHVLAMMDFGFAVVSFAQLYYLHRHKEKVEFMGSLALVCSFILFYAIYLFASYNTARLSLFFLLSASALFLKGRKIGFIWMAFIILSIILGHFIYPDKTDYSNIDIFTTCLYLLALFLICDSYERIREEQNKYLAGLNAKLEKKVRQRTKKLELANKALGIEQQAFREHAFTDQLTGLNNRYKLQVIFDFEKEQVIRYHTELSFILFDIDAYKTVNDKFGHLVGDSVLKHVALILKSTVRNSDIVARWGGDEFIIITPKTSLVRTMQLAETLRQQVNQAFFSHVGHITASFGVSAFQQNDTLDTIIQRADQALHMAKKSGRNKVMAWEK